VFAKSKKKVPKLLLLILVKKWTNIAFSFVRLFLMPQQAVETSSQSTEKLCKNVRAGPGAKFYIVNRPHLFTNICLGSSKFIRLICRDPNISLETSEYLVEN
jgi:hypothetical protein